MKKVNIYSENSRATEVFSEILKTEGCEDVISTETIAFCGVDASVDLHLINAGEHIEPAIKLAEKLSGASCAAVMLLSDEESCDEFGDQLRSNGIIVVAKPLSRQLFVQSLQDAAALQGRIRRMGMQIEETRKICRAKLLLVEKQHMTEQEAHRFIEREAMNRRISRLQLAEELIETHK